MKSKETTVFEIAPVVRGIYDVYCNCPQCGRELVFQEISCLEGHLERCCSHCHAHVTASFKLSLEWQERGCIK